MATTSAEPVFVDTNVLVDATDTRRPRHHAARAILERGAGLVFSAQVAREYLAVATRPVAANGLGMSADLALENLAELRRAIRLLPEEKPLLPTLLALLREVLCEGKAVHDALIVATMRVHHVKVLVTSNPTHFARYGKLVRLVEPRAAGR